MNTTTTHVKLIPKSRESETKINRKLSIMIFVDDIKFGVGVGADINLVGDANLGDVLDIF